MIRKLSAALTGLALAFPLMVATPVAAHSTAGLTVQSATYTSGTDTHVVGTVTNHSGIRQSALTVTATWKNGDTVVATANAIAHLSNLAPHSISSFHITESADVSGTTLTVTTSSSGGGSSPAGGLGIENGAVSGTEVTGTVTNDSTTASASNILVSVLRSNGDIIEDAGSVTVAGPVAAGASAPFTITLENAAATGEDLRFSARTTSGTFLTTWNNYFNDLGSSAFVDEVAYLAHSGITLGCGNNNFCPKNSVTREQMAIFLDRVFSYPDAGDQGFTDISTRTAEAQQAINNLAANGVTSGCSVTPKKYCPTNAVTRGQMSKFLAIAYSLPAASADHFTDDAGDFSEPYNNQMYESGITLGCGLNTYCPNSNVLREQMAAFLYRAENLTP